MGEKHPSDGGLGFSFHDYTEETEGLVSEVEHAQAADGQGSDFLYPDGLTGRPDLQERLGDRR